MLQDFLQVCNFFKITPTAKTGICYSTGVMIQDKITSAEPMAQLTNHAIDAKYWIKKRRR